MRIHIIGLTKKSFLVYKFLIKKNIKISISDNRHKKFFKKYLNNISNKEKNNFYFGDHPNNLIDKANYVMITDGVIQNYYEWQRFSKKKKFSNNYLRINDERHFNN